MFRKDKYLIPVLIVFIVFILSSFILFITLWNNISLNPEVVVSNIIYLYLFLIFASGILLFLIYIFQISEIHLDHSEFEESDSEKEVEKTPQSDLESYLSPYDIDIDNIANFIIPKRDFKESIEDYTEQILQNMAKEFEIVQGIFYLKDENTSEFHATSTYAWTSDKPPAPFLTGEGLPGQVAKNKTIMNIEHIPENYIIVSGLGSGSPKNLLIVPLLLNKETIGVIELASFKKFDDQTEWTIKNLAKIIANSIVTKLRTFRGKK